LALFVKCGGLLSSKIGPQGIAYFGGYKALIGGLGCDIGKVDIKITIKICIKEINHGRCFTLGLDKRYSRAIM
jgi:hypothetical protein